MHPTVKPFFDADTETFSYVVHDGAGSRAAIIDSVLDFDYKSAHTSTAGADRIIAFVREHGLTVDWILETHAHADHLSAAPYLKKHLGGRIGIGDHIREVQEIFRGVFNLRDGFVADGSQFDTLFADGETFSFGKLEGRVMYTPGHTPADMALLIGDAVFVGDTLFMPDTGTARCDFPGGDARRLYRSVRRLLELPGETRVFLCHDYPPEGSGRGYQCETTIDAQKRENIHIRDGVTEDEFVDMRTRRDATLDMPRLIIPSIQVNIRAGEMPAPEDDGHIYLKVPINRL